ncbi:MAG: ATP-binding protein [Candidatus Sericytochromatia bacterium]|nr:ATP-binding protein [Candidatus Sericytochromatia bacterium]
MNTPSAPDKAHRLAQTERLQSLGQLVAGVIHELNNPLTLVGANLQVLEEYVGQMAHLNALYRSGASAEEIEKYVEEVDYAYLQQDLARVLLSCREGASRARGLVDELRRFSITNHYEVGPVDLRRLLASTVRLIQTSYRGRIEFGLELDALVPIVGVSGHLQQVFMNLIVNGCQAIQDKGTLSLRGGRQDGGVLVEVSDTGVGIGPDVLPRIFEPYFSTKGPDQGTGLGLPISKRIVEKHGGRLEVESTPGVGTTFRVVLPLECDPALADDPVSPYEL